MWPSQEENNSLRERDLLGYLRILRVKQMAEQIPVWKAMARHQDG